MNDAPRGQPVGRLALGIGNPGARFVGTRHNVGFEVLDLVAARQGANWVPNGEGDLVAQGQTASGAWWLVKPGTFVNRSGEALRRVLPLVDGDPGRVLVIADDMALDLGTLRLRAAGSPGGHNGLRSVLAELGTQAVPRLRVGIGSASAGDWTSHVLGQFTESEAESQTRAFARAADGVWGFLQGTDLHALAAELNRSLPRGPASGTVKSDVRDASRTDRLPEGSEETPTPPEVPR